MWVVSCLASCNWFGHTLFSVVHLKYTQTCKEKTYHSLTDQITKKYSRWIVVQKPLHPYCYTLHLYLSQMAKWPWCCQSVNVLSFVVIWDSMKYLLLIMNDSICIFSKIVHMIRVSRKSSQRMITENVQKRKQRKTAMYLMEVIPYMQFILK